MNRLLHVLVLASIPGGLAGCGMTDDPNNQDDESSGGSADSGGQSGDSGGQASVGGNSVVIPGSGGNSVVAPGGGGTSSSGGVSSVGGGASTGGEGSMGGALQAPEDLDCPSEQWECETLSCDVNGSEGLWSEPGDCRCNEERPRNEQDCQEGETFLCNHLQSGTSESDRFACECVAGQVNHAACQNNPPSHRFVSQLSDDGDCHCAVFLIR